jgi:sigma-B regulation protein RsbU (phosphoserine phosphatase)
MTRSSQQSREQATAKDTLATVDYITSLLVASEFDLEQLLHEVVRTTAEQTGLKASAVRLLDAETGELVARAAYGLSEWFLAQGPKYGLESRFRQLISSGGVLQVSDVGRESDPAFREIAQHEGIGSFLAIGLYEHSEMIGALSVYAAEPVTFSQTQIDSFHLIASQVSVAIVLARLHEVRAEKERLDRDLQVAAEIQQGDFYDFIELPLGNLGVVVGDVSGKGIQAALLSLSTRTAIRAHAEYEYSIGEIVARANRTIYHDTEPEQFATLFYGVLSATDHRLTYVTALCPSPVLVRDGKIQTLDTDGLPVGILPDQTYEEAILHLEPGDLIVIYSDGYSEIFDREGAMFGDDAVHEFILKHQDRPPDELIDLLEAEVETFLSGSDHGDDRTIVVLSVSPDD